MQDGIYKWIAGGSIGAVAGLTMFLWGSHSGDYKALADDVREVETELARREAAIAAVPKIQDDVTEIKMMVHGISQKLKVPAPRALEEREDENGSSNSIR